MLTCLRWLKMEGFAPNFLDRLAYNAITPPLGARENDISTLANNFGRRMAIERRTYLVGFAPSTISEMKSQDWP